MVMKLLMTVLTICLLAGGVAAKETSEPPTIHERVLAARMLVGQPDGSEADSLAFVLKLSDNLEEDGIVHLVVVWQFWIEDSKSGEFITGYRAGILYTADEKSVYLIDNAVDKPYIVGLVGSQVGVMLKGYDAAFLRVMECYMVVKHDLPKPSGESPAPPDASASGTSPH